MKPKSTGVLFQVRFAQWRQLLVPAVAEHLAGQAPDPEEPDRVPAGRRDLPADGRHLRPGVRQTRKILRP